ncbi:MAG: heparan-alpha-glucosaminide N-acetyltransferase [Pseudomonadota bacterium]
MATGRLVALDVARTVALIGMASFHFVYDLVLFGHLPPETVQFGFWALFARLIAGSFLFLAGVGLWLAHADGIRWPGFWRRLGKVVAAAALITLATYAVMPQNFVFFGILHSIAFASLIGLAVLRLPVGAIVGLVLAVVAIRVWGQSELFDISLLRWTGLGTIRPSSMDFVPPVPWLAPFLAGIAMAKLGSRVGFWAWLATVAQGPVWQKLAVPGRHSLVIYLVHQPVLIALVYAATWLMRGA